MNYNKPLKILAPIGYPWTFTGPKYSKNKILRRRFIPFNKIKSNLDGLTVFNPYDTFNSDLIHAFNRIPLNRKPFVIGFESHLPRVFGLENTGYRKFLVNKLISPNCKKIIAISKYAKEIFIQQLSGEEHEIREKLIGKMELIYPSINISEEWKHTHVLSGKIIFTFVGNHFLRKGGAIALKMALLAQQHNLPFHFNIISKMQMGKSVWSDPISDEIIEENMKLLNLGNVTHYSGLHNEKVQEILANSHFCLLPTFADTFGFSAIEAMMYGTPVIATDHGALPEFINDKNGILIGQPSIDGKIGWLPDYNNRDAYNVVKQFKENVERIAFTAFKRALKLVSNSESYMELRQRARNTIVNKFDANLQSVKWDDLYYDAIETPARSPS